MAKPLGWQRNRELWVRLLERRTGEGVATWKRRIEQEAIQDEDGLRAWLTGQGVTGYAQSLLVMELFGYPDFLLASPEALIRDQYANAPGLRPVLDAVIAATEGFGNVVVKARKTYVALVAPRRTFARIYRRRKSRVDLRLRLEGERPAGRLRPSKVDPTLPLEIGLSSLEDVDAEVREWLRRAYQENR